MKARTRPKYFYYTPWYFKGTLLLHTDVATGVGRISCVFFSRPATPRGGG